MKKIFATLILLVFAASVAMAGEDASAAQKETTEKSATPSAAAVVPTNIVWHKYDEGVKLAAKEGKNIFLEFTAKWCGYCKRMHATTFKDPEVVAMLNNTYVSISVDGDSQDTLNIDGWITTEKAFTREWKVTGYPTYWFVTSAGEKIASISGYRPKEALYDILDYLKDDTFKTVKYEEFLKARKK